MAVISGVSIYEGWSTDSGPWQKLDSRLKRRVLARCVAEELPRLWVPEINAQAKRHGLDDDKQAGVYLDWLDRYGGAKAADLTESGIRDMAESYAKQGQGRRFETLFLNYKTQGVGGLLAVWNELAWFMHQRLGYHTGYGKGSDEKTVKGMIKRLECSSWWRRQIRRMVARKYEGGCFELGLVGASAKTWYCSDRAVIRRKQQNDANAAMLAAVSIQNEAGQSYTLADIAAKTVANKAIRRGELMTRIRGAEFWADRQGMAGLFTTNTLPSRFHSQLKGGGRNPKYKGATPAEGQAWLCKTWAQLRSKLARDGIHIMGYRVAEPHHDGCPHWHMLLWCKPDDVPTVKALMLKYWLREDGTERGALENRVNIKDMIHGQAAGYVAKYISKNIDDVATPLHVDVDHAGETEYVGPDLLGDTPVKPSDRVQAWAALWHIRQFQAIGQPSVTVWRELRRVDKQAAAGGSDTLIRAWLAVHRSKDKKADWCKYMDAQGGAMLRRDDYRLCVHTVDKEKRGRYEVVRSAWACGVQDKASKAGAVPTKRMLWGASGFALQREAMPWTRLNNCTSHNKKVLDSTLQAFHASKVWDSDGKVNEFFAQINAENEINGLHLDLEREKSGFTYSNSLYETLT